MQHFLTHTTDVQGNKYVVIKFDKNTDSILSGFLEQLNSVVGDDRFNNLVSNQQGRDLRDGQPHTHHITVVNVMDLSKINDTKLLDIAMCQPIDDLVMHGIGTAIDDKRGNQTFFVVCTSKTLDDLRKSLDLKPHDFHITLGFADKDVFGRSKGLDSLIDD